MRCERRRAHARHDAHVRDDVGAVGDLDAAARVSASRSGPCSTGSRTSCGRACSRRTARRLSRAPRPGAIQLLFGPASSLFVRADECQVLDARDVGRDASDADSSSDAFSPFSAISVPSRSISSISSRFSSRSRRTSGCGRLREIGYAGDPVAKALQTRRHGWLASSLL